MSNKPRLSVECSTSPFSGVVGSGCWCGVNCGAGRGSNPRPTDYESLASARATRQNGRLHQPISSARQRIWPLPVRFRYAPQYGYKSPSDAGVRTGRGMLARRRLGAHA